MKNKVFLFLFLFSLTNFSFGEDLEKAKTEEQQLEEYFGDNDPWEAWNRRVYYFNYGFDKYFLKPITKGYRAVTPDYVEHRISNFFDNTKNISVLGNSLLQTKGRKSMRTLARFSINAILGLGGLFDVASSLGMPEPYEDFGLTLSHYGVPRGPYLILPILGPSYLRDAFGMAVDSQFKRFVPEYPREISVTSLSVIDKKSRNSFQFYGTNSVFEYEYIRFLYKKYRETEEETHQKINVGGM